MMETQQENTTRGGRRNLDLNWSFAWRFRLSLARMETTSDGDGDMSHGEGEVASESEKAAAGMAGEIPDDDGSAALRKWRRSPTGEKQTRRDDLGPASNRRGSRLPRAATATATSTGTGSFRSG
ncbi:hypothetical protein TIFTF001_044017 [Ficus carica]|uniref:Uncharacterized protein n=1 Tax=Ficus carica TaxID=3494 RepID=A0AA88D4H3_FICCA|nr:hypothetical protein TIFTF001_044017 [Ficus carica]